MSESVSFKPLSREDVAAVLGVSLRTIDNWVGDGSLPAPAKLGSRSYWHPVAFYGWLDRRLMGDASVAEPVAAQPQAGASSPVEVSSQKPVKKAAAEPRKRSVDRMNAKDDAVLKALMAAT